MSDHPRSSWLKTLLLLAGLTVPVAVHGASLSFESHAVSAAGLALDSPVAWLWVGRAAEGTVTRVESGCQEGWVDRGGTARLERERALPEQSIWALVDLTSGEVVVDRPAGSRATRRHLDLAGFAAGGPILSGRRYELLLVRPGIGAWGGAVMDGGPSDADGRSNASVTVVLDQLAPLGETVEPAGELTPGDRLLLADPDHLELWVATVAAEPLSEITSTSASR